MWFLGGNIIYIFAFSVLSQQYNCAGSWNPTSNQTGTLRSCTVNTMVADGLATQSQGISNHGIDTVIPKYSSFSVRKVNSVHGPVAIPCQYWHIEAETRCPTFCRWHYQMHFFIENEQISINVLLNFVPNGSINNISAMVSIMAWLRPGNKPLWTNDG